MKRKSCSPFKNRSGQSLISVIVAAGVGAIVMGFLTDMLIQQGIGQKFISQKLEINDLTNSIISTFSKASNCTCQFAATDNPNAVNYAGLTFDSNDNSGNQFINIKKLYSGCAGVGPLVLAGEGEMLSPSSSLRVNTVRLVNLRRASSQTEWQGQWEISFQYGAGSAIRSVKPVLVTQKFTIDNGASANARITVCNGLSTGTGTQDHLAKWSPTPGVIQDSGVVEDTVTGNVGIGILDPVAALHVTTENLGPITGWYYGNDGSYVRLRTARGNIGSPQFISSGSVFGGVSVGAWNGVTLNNDATVRISAVATQDHSATSFGTALAFATTANDSLPTSGIERMRIDHNGNIGIGTSSPVDRLDVVGAIHTSGTAAGMRANEGYFDYCPGCSGGTTRIAAMGPDAATAGAFQVSLYSSNGTVSNEAFRINNAGNVGIGTTSPKTKIDVTGEIKVGNTAIGCDADREGSMRYNSTQKFMEFCNGASWQPVAPKVYLVADPAGAVLPYLMDQAKSMVYCDLGDQVVSGGGRCPSCDSGADPACSKGDTYIDRISIPITHADGRLGWLYSCDAQGNAIDDTVQAVAYCQDFPPYR